MLVCPHTHTQLQLNHTWLWPVQGSALFNTMIKSKARDSQYLTPRLDSAQSITWSAAHVCVCVRDFGRNWGADRQTEGSLWSSQCWRFCWRTKPKVSSASLPSGTSLTVKWGVFWVCFIADDVQWWNEKMYLCTLKEVWVYFGHYLIYYISFSNTTETFKCLTTVLFSQPLFPINGK